MATFLKTALVLAICLIIADVIGVILCLIFDIVPLRGDSALLPYAIWLVLGGFTGFVVLTGAGGWIAGDEDSDWSARPDAARIAGAIAAVSAALLIALAILFYFVIWDRRMAGAYFVPDSMPHTLAFLGATIAAMLIGWAVLRPARRESPVQ